MHSYYRIIICESYAYSISLKQDYNMPTHTFRSYLVTLYAHYAILKTRLNDDMQPQHGEY